MVFGDNFSSPQSQPNHEGTVEVSQAQPNHEGVVEVSRLICHLMETFYGSSWQFTTNMEFRDLSYTQLALGAHTENSYFSSPAV